MQLMPQTASTLGVKNSFDPAENVDGGVRYLRELLLQYNGDAAKALAAYNAGPHRVQQYDGVPPYRETHAYVARIINDYNRKKVAEAKQATQAGARRLRRPRRRPQWCETTPASVRAASRLAGLTPLTRHLPFEFGHRMRPTVARPADSSHEQETNSGDRGCRGRACACWCICRCTPGRSSTGHTFWSNTEHVNWAYVAAVGGDHLLPVCAARRALAHFPEADVQDHHGADLLGSAVHRLHGTGAAGPRRGSDPALPHRQARKT